MVTPVSRMGWPPSPMEPQVTPLRALYSVLMTVRTSRAELKSFSAGLPPSRRVMSRRICLSWQRWILLVPIAISFIIFLTSIFAEANRTPFDMSECETDLVGGYHTEYSSMKFAQFFMGEYAAMVVGSSLVITLFLGGWSIGFGLDGWLNEHVANWVAVICQLIAYVLKLLFFVFFFVWVRWTLPRFRYDQVMKLGWMVFFELAVINIFITAAILYFVK